MALNGLLYADVQLRNDLLTHSSITFWKIPLTKKQKLRQNT